LGNGDGTFQAGANYVANGTSFAIATGSFSGNGRADIAYRERKQQRCELLLGFAPAPGLTLAITHAGDFTQGQSGATYSITISNVGYASTSGTVTVTDTLPHGVAAINISGEGWNCVLGTLTCTRENSLATSASYPAIIVMVTVAAAAPGSITNTVTVSGGGQASGISETARDFTTNFTPGQVAQVWSPLTLPASLTAASAALLMTERAIPPLVTRPAGLTTGDQYQLLFVTADKFHAISTNISDYNAFVSSEAALNPALAAFDSANAVTWTAIGSTASVNANVNAPSSGSVYTLEGVMVANSANSLYSGQNLLSPPNINQYGASISNVQVWTGTGNANGTPGSQTLEASATVVGDSGLTNLGWISDGATDPFNFGTGNLATPGGLAPLYALSSVITVLPSVSASEVGVFRDGFLWILDSNGNHQFDQGIDQVFAFQGFTNQPGDLPVTGDWNGSGVSKVASTVPRQVPGSSTTTATALGNPESTSSISWAAYQRVRPVPAATFQ
jgi:uncharacterized repeat protein (TIGR01451 family)